jgi:hypothetical protein
LASPKLANPLLAAAPLSCRECRRSQGRQLRAIRLRLLAAIRANITTAAIEDVSLYAGEMTRRASLLGDAGWILEEHLLDHLMSQATDS